MIWGGMNSTTMYNYNALKIMKQGQEMMRKQECIGEGRMDMIKTRLYMYGNATVKSINL